MIKGLYWLIGFIIAIVGVLIYLIVGDHRAGRKRRRLRVFVSEITSNGFTVRGKIIMSEIKEGQKADIVITPKTANGHPAAIEPGTAIFSSSDESVISVVQDPADELKATIHGLDGSNNESVVIEFRADGDRSEGVREIVGSVAVVCTQGDAVTFDIEIGPAVDDTPAAEPVPAAEPTPADEPAADAAGNDAGADPATTDNAGE